MAPSKVSLDLKNKVQITYLTGNDNTASTGSYQQKKERKCFPATSSPAKIVQQFPTKLPHRSNDNLALPQFPHFSTIVIRKAQGSNAKKTNRMNKQKNITLAARSKKLCV